MVMVPIHELPGSKALLFKLCGRSAQNKCFLPSAVQAKNAQGKFGGYSILFFLFLILLCTAGCSRGSPPIGQNTPGKQQTAASKEETGNKDAGRQGTTSEKAAASTKEPPAEPLVIELDPGHGGKQTGAENEEKGVSEKTINLKIAQYLKEELEAYKNVTVYLTRDTDVAVELDERVEKAVLDKADVLISLHNNASGPTAAYDHGSTVLVQRGAYHKDKAQISQELGCYVLVALSELGLENQGLLFRICENLATYPNGELTDYYAIIREAAFANLPSILIEHAFLDHEEDYAAFLADDEKLRALAAADAKGIASYYRLSEIEGETPRPRLTLENYEEKITLIQDKDGKENEYFVNTYFPNSQ